MANLSKFGVPLDGVNGGILQPKQKYRFRVVFQNFGENNGLREMTYSVVTCTRPRLIENEVELHSYNSVAWIRGKHSFDPIEITLRDDITNSVISSCGAQVQKQMNHFEQTSAVSGINYKFTMEIQTLDGTTSDALESWVVDGCWITSYQISEGDYASGDSQIASLTIRYDNATNVSGPNTNQGTTVGGAIYPPIVSPAPVGGTTFG